MDQPLEIKIAVRLCKELRSRTTSRTALRNALGPWCQAKRPAPASPKPGAPALRYSPAAPAIRDIQGSDRSRWYTGYKRLRRNVARHDRSGRDDCVIANGHAGKDRRSTTDPDVGTKPNWRKPGWTRRLYGMVPIVKNGHKVPYKAMATDRDAVIGHNRGTGVDENTLAK